MNSLNYIGSKKKIFKHINEICKNNIKDLKNKIFFDIFAGTGVVGYNMEPFVKKVLSNDLEYYSFIINCALLQCNYSDKLEKLINKLNNLKGIEGLMYKHFSPNKNSERMYFTPDNAKKADSIRIHIQKELIKNNINEREHKFLLASLITSIDKIANTTSVYGAFLKKFKASAKKELVLLPIHKNYNINIGENEVYKNYAEDIIGNYSSDIVYLDPPYNHRQYSGNYSQLNYLAIYNQKLEIVGKTGLIKNKTSSKFCSKVYVKEVFEKLINNIKSNYILLSYNSEGLLSVDFIKKILIEKGDITLYKIKYGRFNSHKNTKKKFVEEYIWFVDTFKKNNLFTEQIINTN